MLDLSIPTLDHRRADVHGHICLPRYRADDGQFTRCWCGCDVRDQPMLRDNVIPLHPAVRRDKAAG